MSDNEIMLLLENGSMANGTLIESIDSRQNQKVVFWLKSRRSVRFGLTNLPRWLELQKVLAVLGEFEFLLTVVIL